jgi:hypothetical protein
VLKFLFISDPELHYTFIVNAPVLEVSSSHLLMLNEASDHRQLFIDSPFFVFSHWLVLIV